MQDEVSTFVCEVKLLLSYCEHEEYSSVNFIYGLPVTVANARTMLLQIQIRSRGYMRLS